MACGTCAVACGAHAVHMLACDGKSDGKRMRSVTHVRPRFDRSCASGSALSKSYRRASQRSRSDSSTGSVSNWCRVRQPPCLGVCIQQDRQLRPALHGRAAAAHWALGGSAVPAECAAQPGA